MKEKESINPADYSKSIHKRPYQNEWFIKYLISSLLILIGISSILLSSALSNTNNTNWNEPLSQLGLTFVISGITFISVKQFLEKGNRVFTENLIQGSESKIKDNLEKVHESLYSLSTQSDILRGAIKTNIIQIYENRRTGLDDIMKDMETSTSIKMIGISLREYFVSSGHYYPEMEKLLKRIEQNIRRTIQVLIINPNCEQATIRAERESDTQKFSKDSRYEESGFYSDVTQSIRYLSSKTSKGINPNSDPDPTTNQDEAKSDAHSNRIQSKVYSSAPSCFMVITDRHVYIEQYHYGLPKSGLIGGNFPLLKFPAIKGNDEAPPSPISQHLNGHFDYIWDQVGSMETGRFMDEFCFGVSKSAWECNLRNLYTNRQDADRRIEYVLRNAKKVDLIGISLRDFLHGGKGFYSIIEEISRSIQVQCLFLDPISEQGILRSTREEPEVDKGNLLYEVITSLRSVDRLKQHACQIDGRLYHASTNCFLILTDSAAIVEQYHYGSDKPGATILGGKVPVLEFSEDSNMYSEMKGHFDYIWKEDGPSVSIDEWRSKNDKDISSSGFCG